MGQRNLPHRNQTDPECSGIKYEYIDEVNKFIKDYIKEVEVNMCDVDMDVNDAGYPTIGARNVMACIGNSHCIKGNVNTAKLARKIERLIFRPTTTSKWLWQAAPMTV